MKILFHLMNFSPELTGIGKFNGEMVEWFSNKGHSVYVIAAPPYYPQWRVATGHSAMSYRRESLGPAQVYRCPVWVPRRPTGIKRILHLTSYGLTSCPLVLAFSRLKPELVFTVEPPLSTAPCALASAALAGAVSWLHIQDFEVQAAFSSGVFRRPTLMRWMEKMEGALIKRFDRVSTISNSMLARLRATIGDESMDRSEIFHNWTDLHEIRPHAKHESFRPSLEIPQDGVVALYSGNMGKKQGLDSLVEAAVLHQNETRLYFIFCGDGAARDELYGASKGLAQVRWLPLQPADRLNDLLNTADIHLLPQKPGLSDIVLPSKLINIMASGGPVVAMASKDSDVAGIMEGCGIRVDPGNVGDFAAAVGKLFKDKDLRRAMGEASRARAACEFGKDAVLGKIETSMQHLIDLGGHRGRKK